MTDGFERIDVAPGVRLFAHRTAKFKAVSVRAFVHQPLGDEATAVAVLPSVLRRGCRRTASMRAITVFLEGLYGASFGADVFKMGEQQVVGFSLDVINDRYAPRPIQSVRQGIEFLGRVMTQPVLAKGAFRSDWVAQEVENQKRAIEGLVNDRGAYAYERCVREMCREEPYRIYEYGRVEDLPRVDGASLAALHRRLLETAPIDVFVTGDVAPAKAAAMVSRALPKRRRPGPAPPAPTDRPAPAEPREIVERMDVEQGNLVIGARTGTRWSDADAMALSMANGVLGAFPHSKLFANVRERDNLAYSVHSSIDLAKGLLFITAGIDFAKYADALRTIRAELASLQAGEVSEPELEKTRASLIDRIRSRDDSASAMVGAFHEMIWHGCEDSGARLMERYRAVTKEDVVRAARRIRLDTVYFLTR